ncbi:monocarboxylate transporter 14-like [Lingula anatina]|uniref:Monocarboxylate transporter 14-like n=1 Tax=Lingula anatina TaxID=7574 RepID=A0A1S3J366_LINAN|nr:monocarboxylate transporter 14-like [Lingula anatina]|eukprot:XP_013404721.1 monocarboxylate transporter 14-like [Lingula anatina]
MVDTSPNTTGLNTAEHDGYPNEGFENDTIDGDSHDDNSDSDAKERSSKRFEELSERGAGKGNGYSDKQSMSGSSAWRFIDSRQPSTEENCGVQTDRCIDWLVVLASFFIHFIVGGILYTFGVLYITLLNEFEETKSETSWVGSIQVAMTWGMGIVSVQGHFEKRKSLAMGVAVCGSGVGTFAMAPCIEFLIKTISWRYTCLVLAGLSLSGVGISILLFPSELKINEGSKTEPTLSCSNKTRKCFKNMFHISLLRRADVVVWLVCHLIIQVGLVVPHTYIPDIAVGMGIEVNNAAFLVSIVGITSTVSRVVMGVIADFRCVNRRYMLGTNVMIAGVMVAILPFMKEYGVIATVCTFYGLSFGIIISLTAVVLRDLVGIEELGPSFGLTMLAKGLGSLLLSAGGSLYDLFGSYDVTFYITGSLLFVAGGILLLLPWIRELQGRCCYHGSANITTETGP